MMFDVGSVEGGSHRWNDMEHLPELDGHTVNYRRYPVTPYHTPTNDRRPRPFSIAFLYKRPFRCPAPSYVQNIF